MRKEFKPKNKLKCLLCGDTIQSEYSGHFKSCKCGKCFIDETYDYCRVLGNWEDFEWSKI